ncbi:MAG: DUF1232 domain-containing protein [Bradyrhizobiaceae bacterium]|nr:DUF1232 domain-containing protein [Bradyrhizobiaceae bacterium]
MTAAAEQTGTFTRRTRAESARVAKDFWQKLRRVAPHVPFAEDALTAYYCALDRATPTRVRAAIFGALAYFVVPADAMPDILPVLGFTDDAAVIAATIQLIAAYVLPEHREAARRALEKIAGSSAR